MRAALAAILAEKTPHSLADWTLKDPVHARAPLIPFAQGREYGNPYRPPAFVRRFR